MLVQGMAGPYAPGDHAVTDDLRPVDPDRIDRVETARTSVRVAGTPTCQTCRA
jgi:hypothetical protein